MTRRLAIRHTRALASGAFLIVAMVAMALLPVRGASAQQAARSDTSARPAPAATPDTAAATTRALPGGPGSPGGPQTPYIMPPISQALLADLHNKIIHFPIVLGLVSVVMVIVSRRRPQYEPVAFWLVWFAVLSTLAAYFTGLAQSTEFQHRPKHWLVDTHMRWGIGLALAQCVWLLTLLRRGTRGFATVWSLVVAALVLVTAFLGGLVAHGRGAAPPPSSRAESR